MEGTSQAITTRAVGIRYGFLTSFASIILFIGISVAGLSSGGQWANYPIYMVLIILAHQYYKESNGDGFMSYGQGINIAFWLSVIYSIIYSAFTYIYIKFIDTAFIETLKKRQIEELQAKGLPDDQTELAIRMINAFMKPEALFFFGIMGGIMSIVLVALIVTIFTQKRNTEQVF